MISLSFSLLALLACGDKDDDTGGGADLATVCIDGDLGRSLEYEAATAIPEGDDFQAMSCGKDTLGTDSNDHGWTWAAPADGGYTFSTVGSTFDTVLFVLDGDCQGEVLACNNDATFDTIQSEVYLELVEAQEVIIVVDGYDAFSSGTIELKILQDL